MSRLRYRDEESSSTGTILGVLAGAVAGFAVGMLVAQRVGGVSGLTSKLRRKRTAAAPTPRSPYDTAGDVDDFEDVEEDDFETDEQDGGLEERVLEAFRNDPILCERAVDIGSIGEGMIELAGWVEDEDESHHAVTIARGVPGVDTVVNRIAIGAEEERFADAARKFKDGDAAMHEAHWEGQTVGTGRRRQGNSSDLDRHADPKVPLEERWLQTDDAVLNAADDMDGISAERRARAKKSAARGDRAGGAANSPSGVPKADHVANPLDHDAGGNPR